MNLKFSTESFKTNHLTDLFDEIRFEVMDSMELTPHAYQNQEYLNIIVKASPIQQAKLEKIFAEAWTAYRKEYEPADFFHGMPIFKDLEKNEVNITFLKVVLSPMFYQNENLYLHTDISLVNHRVLMAIFKQFKQDENAIETLFSAIEKDIERIIGYGQLMHEEYEMTSEMIETEETDNNASILLTDNMLPPKKMIFGGEINSLKQNNNSNNNQEEDDNQYKKYDVSDRLINEVVAFFDIMADAIFGNENDEEVSNENISNNGISELDSQTSSCSDQAFPISSGFVDSFSQVTVVDGMEFLVATYHSDKLLGMKSPILPPSNLPMDVSSAEEEDRSPVIKSPSLDL